MLSSADGSVFSAVLDRRNARVCHSMVRSRVTKSASSCESSTLGRRGRSMLSEVSASETQTRSCERVEVDVDAECCSPGDGIVMSFRSARMPEKRGVWNA